MSAIYTAELNIQNAKNFLRAVSSSEVSRDYLYAFIGRSTPWGTSTTTGVELFPTPTDKLTEELVTRSNIFGIKRITDADISHVVPRKDWTSGNVYDAYSNNILTSTLLASNFYVMTDQFNVYKCIVSPGTASTIKPTGTSTSNLVTGDGYTWKYLYTVSTGDALKFLTTDWLPIPTGSRRDSAQLAVEAAASYSNGQPLYGHGNSAVEELGGYYLLFNLKFTGSENGTLPTNEDFRQIGLLMNPVLIDSNDAAATGNNYSASQIDVNKGRMIYVENRAPVARSASQSETAIVVVQF